MKMSRLIVLIVLMFSFALPAIAGLPHWVWSDPEVGKVKFFTALPVDGGVGSLEITARTETTLSFWTAYRYINSGTTTWNWVRVSPVMGDTLMVIGAGKTKSFTFEGPGLHVIQITSGDANFLGE